MAESVVVSILGCKIERFDLPIIAAKTMLSVQDGLKTGLSIPPAGCSIVPTNEKNNQTEPQNG